MQLELPASVLTKSQKKSLRKELPKGFIRVDMRYDDECGNGHNTFSITGSINEGRGTACGCIHDDIEKHFPELSHLIKWHLCSSDGPLHYIANTLYHARAVSKYEHFAYLRDDLLRGDVLLGLFSDAELAKVKERFAGFELRVESKPTYDSKESNLEAARNCAIWPDATLEQLQSEAALTERLPSLLREFKETMESIGFSY